MPCVSSRAVLPPQLAIAKSAAIFDTIYNQLIAAGFSLLRKSTDDGVAASGNQRARILRFPSFDPYNSNPAFLFLTNLNGGNINSYPVQDFDINDGPYALGINISGAAGNYAAPGWPNSTPTLASLTSAFSYGALAPDTLTNTISVIASEYGFICELTSGAVTSLLTVSRPLHNIRMRRDQHIITNATFPVTLAAPVGAQHLSFEIDGNTVNVTLPTGTPLTSHRLAQSLTMALGGKAEALVTELDSFIDQVTLRIPPSRGPIGGWSTTRPRFALTYVDTSANALQLGIYQGTASTVTGTTIKKNGVCWPALHVRIGATVVNQTQALSTIVTGFSTTTTQDDTLIVASSAGWLNTDALVVCPGPEQICHAAGINGGHWIGVPKNDMNTHVKADGLVDFVLDDKYGEAQNQYQVGQTVLISNHGTMVRMVMVSIVGYVLGDTVTNGNTGAIGVIKGIDVPGKRLLVDTISGPSTLSYNGISWNATNTVTGALGGASTISGSVTSSGTLGPSPTGVYQRVPVTAIAQIDAPNGDYRTVLTLNLGAAPATAPIWFPGVVIGCYAKVTFGKAITATGFAPGGANVDVPAQVSFGIDTDVNRNDINVLSTSPSWEPDYETGGIGLADIVVRFIDAAGFGEDVIGSMPHLKGVSSRTSMTFYDVIHEDKDATRAWVMINIIAVGAVPAAAHNTTNTAQWLAMGPGMV